MDILTSFSVIALAALVHASFQLSVSVVTLLSGHAAGKRVSPTKSLRLVNAFLWGTILITSLIVFTLLYLVSVIDVWQNPPLLWTVVCSALVGIGLAVWGVYYRRGNGTPLWIPRAFAKLLSTRVRTTTMSVEAFSLGITTVIAELPFMAAPIVAATLALTFLPPDLQIAGALAYVAIASLGMFTVTVLIGSGHNLSHIQRWRESNKRFLQFSAGSGLVILGFFLYVSQVVYTSAANMAGVL